MKPRHKLTATEIAEVRRLYGGGDGPSYNDLARQFGCSDTQIAHVIRPEQRPGQRPGKSREAMRRAQDQRNRLTNEAAAGRRAANLPPIDCRIIREEELQKRRRAIPRDTRGKTAIFCGDPLPGESALDRKQSPDGLTARERAAGFVPDRERPGPKETRWRL